MVTGEGVFEPLWAEKAESEGGEQPSSPPSRHKHNLKRLIQRQRQTQTQTKDKHESEAGWQKLAAFR